MAQFRACFSGSNSYGLLFSEYGLNFFFGMFRSHIDKVILTIVPTITLHGRYLP